MVVTPRFHKEVLDPTRHYGEQALPCHPYLNGLIFERVRDDLAFFGSVQVDPELGTIVWPNGADIDPDVLILGRPAAFEAPSQ
jgi:hypothetical protein